MGQLNLGKESDINLTKTHAEILQSIDEIKDFETRFQEYDLNKTNFDEDLVDVGSDIIEFKEIEKDIPNFVELDKEKLKKFGLIKSDYIKRKKIKKTIRFRSIKKKKTVLKTEDEIKTINPTTFKLRINKEGKLINTDLKEIKPQSKTKKSSILKKINFKKLKNLKKKTSDEKSKKPKLKGGFSKLGRLKKAIPTKTKKQEKKEETKEE